MFSREDSVKITSIDSVVSDVKREKGSPATLVKHKSSRRADCKRNDWICFTIPT
jgi:hypothetical protein